MDTSTLAPSATTRTSDLDAPARASAPHVLLIDACSARRAAQAHCLERALPGVRVSSCNDTSEALLRLAATRHALVVLDVASCDGHAQLASEYWRLTDPDMHQLLVYPSLDLVPAAQRAAWRGQPGAAGSHNLGQGITHCSWYDMPETMVTWAQRYQVRQVRDAHAVERA